MAIDGIKIFDEECETGKFFLILILLKSCFTVIPSYKTELHIMTSQTELLTLQFYSFKFFGLVTRFDKNFHIVLELVARDF